jgi:hypothetical protein
MTQVFEKNKQVAKNIFNKVNTITLKTYQDSELQKSLYKTYSTQVQYLIEDRDQYDSTKTVMILVKGMIDRKARSTK